MDGADDTGGMAVNISNKHIARVEAELDWLRRIIEFRFATYFDNGAGEIEETKLYPPEADKDTGLGSLISELKLNTTERIILALSFAPSLRPQMLDIFFTRNNKFDRGFTEFGGIKGEQHGGFLPTGETAAFIAAGSNLEERLCVSEILSQSHDYYQQDLIRLQPSKNDEPRLSGTLIPGPNLIDRICFNRTTVPEFNHKFPAQKLETYHSWSDLVLPKSVRFKLNEIIAWLENESTIMNDWGLAGHVKPGFRSLFYGPPGTGKTMAAGLIGKQTRSKEKRHDVYRVDLSMVVSKYIGETEKNLSRVFDRAEHKQWILFFDEADSLFGQRTQTKSSNDRYSNQEVSYLLQRIESYNGVVILATNLKENIDSAFTRRFQSKIYFPMPDVQHREQLWKKILGDKMPRAEDINLKSIASEYELSGGSIINVVRSGALQAVQRKNGEAELTSNDLHDALKRELKKQGKSII